MKSKYPKNYIKELRLERGLTLDALAKRVGVTNPYISMMETGKRGLSWVMLRRLAAGLECHPMDITEGVGRVANASDITPRSESEKTLLKTFRGLADGERRLFQHMLESFSVKKNKLSKVTGKRGRPRKPR
jgi:transcriptional regulator with XRE-family HTH domain